MTGKEKIKAEVERLQKKYYQRGEESDAKHDGNGMYWGGVLSCLNEIHTFINSLPEESVGEDLEEACEQLAENARKHKAETSSPFFNQTDYRQGVMDGAKWQFERVKEALLSEVLPYFMHGGEADEVVAKLDEVLSQKK